MVRSNVELTFVSGNLFYYRLIFFFRHPEPSYSFLDSDFVSFNNLTEFLFGDTDGPSKESRREGKPK